MKENFKEKLSLNAANKILLNKVNDILLDYKEQGYILTLRQAYYQLVSRDIIPNTAKEYAKLSKLLTVGRMSGVVDWSSIEDRGRQPKIPYYVSGVQAAIEDTIDQYRIDRQQGQENYVEVCIEKDALSSIFSRVTNQYHVRLLVNKGYSSCSAMYNIYERIISAYKEGATKATILYFGDHDPSGIDMIRDVSDRVGEMLSKGKEKERIKKMVKNSGGYFIDDFPLPDVSTIFQVKQLALNMIQVNNYGPPENPAKIDDPRAKGYMEKYGDSSWELDALQPNVLVDICKRGIESEINMNLYEEMLETEADQKRIIGKFLEDYNEKN